MMKFLKTIIFIRKGGIYFLIKKWNKKENDDWFPCFVWFLMKLLTKVDLIWIFFCITFFSEKEKSFHRKIFINYKIIIKFNKRMIKFFFHHFSLIFFSLNMRKRPIKCIFNNDQKGDEKLFLFKKNDYFDREEMIVLNGIKIKEEWFPDKLKQFPGLIFKYIWKKLKINSRLSIHQKWEG